MKSLSICLTPEDRDELRALMFDQNESKPASAVRRALERWLGIYDDAEAPSIVSIRISPEVVAEIARRGLSTTAAVRLAIRARHLK